MIAAGVGELAPVVGTRGACAALAVPRASHYRHLRGPRHGPPMPRPAPARALSEPEWAALLGELHAPRFLDASPAAVYATLLDEGTYLASQRTMYRILTAAAEVRERRDQLRHPAYARPELLATGPNELWSWDISKLRGPVKWTYYQLYVILDVFSATSRAGWSPRARAPSSPNGSSPRPPPRRASSRGSSRSTPTGGPRCAASRSPSCSPTSGSSRATRGPTCPTTTRTARPSSRRRVQVVSATSPVR